MKKGFFIRYGLLFAALIFYSCSSVCSKWAASYPFLSGGFILFYGLSIAVLGVYAGLWQQVLKRLDLSVAYAAKPISTILTMTAGIILFHEALTLNMIIGTIIILIGINVVVTEYGG